MAVVMGVRRRLPGAVTCTSPDLRRGVSARRPRRGPGRARKAGGVCSRCRVAVARRGCRPSSEEPPRRLPGLRLALGLATPSSAARTFHPCACPACLAVTAAAAIVTVSCSLREAMARVALRAGSIPRDRCEGGRVSLRLGSYRWWRDRLFPVGTPLRLVSAATVPGGLFLARSRSTDPRARSAPVTVTAPPRSVRELARPSPDPAALLQDRAGDSGRSLLPRAKERFVRTPDDRPGSRRGPAESVGEAGRP